MKFYRFLIDAICNPAVRYLSICFVLSACLLTVGCWKTSDQNVEGKEENSSTNVDASGTDVDSVTPVSQRNSEGAELNQESTPASIDASDVSPNDDNVPVPDDVQDSDQLGFPLDRKLTPAEEARLDEAIKKAQEFNAADYQEPELTPEQEAQLKEKQKQADSSRADKDAFLSIASEIPRKTLTQQAIDNNAIGQEGDYPDSVLDPNSPDYDWKAAVKAKPLLVDLGEPLVDNPADLVRLHPKQNIWFDKKNKTAVLHGAVGLNRGALELFACTGRVTRDRSFKDRFFADGPKAHESVLVFDIIPHLMHAALLAAGAQPGKPAVFSPQFVPPSGTAIEVIVRWKDKQGNVQQAAAGDWVLDEQTQEIMKIPFVFTGSMFMVNRDGRRMYMGDSDGELICVSNFPSAVMDVPIESSGDNNSRLFIANEAKIPPCGTPVTMILKPIEKSKSKVQPTSEQE